MLAFVIASVALGFSVWSLATALRAERRIDAAIASARLMRDQL